MAKYAKFFSVGGGVGPNGLQLPLGTVLDTTLRQVQDGTGTGSTLYLSTTGLRVGTTAASAMYWDNVNNRLGIGTNTPVTNFEVYSSAGGYISHNASSGYNGFSGFRCNVVGGTRGYMELNPNTGEFKVGADGSGYFLTLGAAGVERMRVIPTGTIVKGSGSTSTTSSLLVQNSSGTAALTVRDDLYVFGGSRVYSTGNMYMDGNSGTLFSAWGQLNLQGASYVQIMNDTLRVGSQNFNFINTSFSPNNSTNSNLILSGNGSSFTNAGAGSTSVGNVLSIPIGLSTSTGNVTLNHINIGGTINTTGGTTLQRGFYYNPTLTGTVGFTHRAIETVTGDVLFGTTSGKATFGSGVAGTSYIEIKPGTSTGNNRITFNDFDGGTATRGGWLEMSTYFAELIFGSYNSLNIGPSNKKYRLYLEPANHNVIISQGSVAPTDSGALFQVKGTGSTSATTSLLAQNSSGVDMLRMQDNGSLTLGTFASGLGKIIINCDPAYGFKTIMENNFGSPILRQVSTDTLYVGGQSILGLIGNNYLTISAPIMYGNSIQASSSNSCFYFSGSVNSYGASASAPARNFRIGGDLTLQSGGYVNAFELSPTFNFDISGGRIVKGFYYNPTLTNIQTLDKHYGIQTTSGGAYINTATPQASACLQADSTTQGFLPPRMTSAQKIAISTPTTGLIVFDTDLVRPCFYNGATWITL